MLAYTGLSHEKRLFPYFIQEASTNTYLEDDHLYAQCPFPYTCYTYGALKNVWSREAVFVSPQSEPHYELLVFSEEKSYDVGKQYPLKNCLCEAIQSFRAAVDKGTIKTPIDLIK